MQSERLMTVGCELVIEQQDIKRTIVISRRHDDVIIVDMATGYRKRWREA